MLQKSILKVYLKVKGILSDEKGQAMTEYGLIIALIAVIAIAGITAMSGGLTKAFKAITDALPKE